IETPEFNENDTSIDSNEVEKSDSECEKENEFPASFFRCRKRMRICSSSESDNETSNANITRKDVHIASDGTVWKEIQKGGCAGRSPSHNIFKATSGPTAYTKRNIISGQVSSAFMLLIDNRMIEHIKNCTETEAQNVLGNHWTTSIDELYAFIAILYARGAYESKNMKISYLWSKKWGPPFFKSTMSRNRFTEILRFIRFDKKNERSSRLQVDKFALVSETWNAFMNNSQNCYKPGSSLTIDEQLFPTKARCRFTQYMPNKPSKFGIKFWLVTDAENRYVLNGFPYLGKDNLRISSTPLHEYVVLKLVEPYLGCGRIGTLRSNKKELPQIAKVKKDNMARYETILLKSDNIVLTIYKSKPAKKVLVLSSKHTNVKIAENYKLLPETVEFYNKTKFGVDVIDQMARKYSVKASSRRWPLQVFYNILDLAGINAWSLYKDITGENITRKQFLYQLCEELADKYTHNKMLKSSQPEKWSIIETMKSTSEHPKEDMQRKSC
ncbi:piggyBac transposable element-derived protein 4-like, partial [Condylostylus longicornis]|uniref:piggyBac transposable element-derived protein 4-like n=1 Tax=Condylostylus longicornis TaxID=2530218 RepID=UPI00244D9EEB